MPARKVGVRALRKVTVNVVYFEDYRNVSAASNLLTGGTFKATDKIWRSW